MLQGSASQDGPTSENSKSEESTPSHGQGCSLLLGVVISQCSSPASDCSTSASQSRNRINIDISGNLARLLRSPLNEVPFYNR